MSRKRLVVMRHAKSDSDSAAKSDHDRPLNHRGQREAPMVGALLRQKGYVPELVVSSDSKRTQQTWEGLGFHGEAGELEKSRVVFDNGLYLAGVDAVRKAISELDSELANVETLMVLGHNPGWEEVVRTLSGRSVDMKTAHAVILEAKDDKSSWQDLVTLDRGFSLVDVVKPQVD